MRVNTLSLYHNINLTNLKLNVKINTKTIFISSIKNILSKRVKNQGEREKRQSWPRWGHEVITPPLSRGPEGGKR